MNALYLLISGSLEKYNTKGVHTEGR